MSHVRCLNSHASTNNGKRTPLKHYNCFAKKKNENSSLTNPIKSTHFISNKQNKKAELIYKCEFHNYFEIIKWHIC